MAKKLVAVGCDFESDVCEVVSLCSDRSLLDWDLVLIVPNIGVFKRNEIDSYQGKISLSDFCSVQLKESGQHWSREIKDAYGSGKSIYVLLDSVDEVYVDSGKRQYSGTGRNRQTTRLVNGYSNYNFFPIDISPVNAKGKRIKLTQYGVDVASDFYNLFEEYFEFHVTIESIGYPLFTTQHGEKTVGTVIKNSKTGGLICLLPYVEFHRDEFYDETEDDWVWNSKGDQFVKKFLSGLVKLDKSLRLGDEKTEIPDWVRSSDYSLPKETKLTEQLLKIDGRIADLTEKKGVILEKLSEAANLKNLLFEKGKPLETSVVEALNVLGFKAENYNDGESEFDVVFEAREGRFIGEVEGKDTKPINVNKLRQLDMNIHEDLTRDDVEEPAKAVLFGNPHRLHPINDRAEPFTKKCVTASNRNGTALVATADLFNVVRSLLEKRDARYAQRCRRAILESVGFVEFPQRLDAKSKKIIKIKESKS